VTARRLMPLPLGGLSSTMKMHTNTSNDIEQEIEVLWDEASTYTGLEAIYDAEFGDLLDEYSRKAETIAQSSLQPWFAILEQAISWLAALHLALTTGSKPKTEELRVPWALTGAACSQAVAIRKLCLHGLDLPAKTVLRSLIETFNIFIVTTYDEELRRLYRQAKDFDQARNVWQQHFTEKKLQARLAKIFEEYEIELEVHDEFRQWQAQEKTAASQAVHVSYTAVLFATAPYPADRTTFQPGMFGSATLFSVRTLAQACKAIWFFSMVGFNLLIRANPKDGSHLYFPSKDDTGDKIVINGHFVLDRLVRKHWHEDQIPMDG
jgi:hypothetical protein